MEQKVPYKIYLEENEIPKAWYNVRADMKNKPAPLLNPATLQPMGIDDLKGVFCEELCKQELDNDTAYFPIPDEIRDFYKMYRPSPLIRAYFLEKHWAHRLKSTISSKATTLPEATSSILPLRRLIMPRNRGSKE